MTFYSVAVSLFPNNVTLTGGGREARCVGRVGPQLSETQIGKPRTEEPRAGDELSSPRSRVISRKDRPKDAGVGSIPVLTPDQYLGIRGGKAFIEEPVGSTKAWSDLRTPEKEDLGCLRSSPAARAHSPAEGTPGSLHGNREGNMGVQDKNKQKKKNVQQKSYLHMYIFKALKVQRSHKQKKRRCIATSQKTKVRATFPPVNKCSCFPCSCI